MAMSVYFRLVIFSLFLLLPSLSRGEKFTQEERSLASVPKGRIADPRLRQVYRKMAKKYRHIYAFHAADGYILPNELNDLRFQRRLIKWVISIDKEYSSVSKKIKRLSYKMKRTTSPKKRRALAEELRKLRKKRERYEKMILRYSCRYLPKFREKNDKTCRKILNY